MQRSVCPVTRSKRRLSKSEKIHRFSQIRASEHLRNIVLAMWPSSRLRLWTTEADSMSSLQCFNSDLKRMSGWRVVCSLSAREGHATSWQGLLSAKVWNKWLEPTSSCAAEEEQSAHRRRQRRRRRACSRWAGEKEAAPAIAKPRTKANPSRRATSSRQEDRMLQCAYHTEVPSNIDGIHKYPLRMPMRAMLSA